MVHGTATEPVDMLTAESGERDAKVTKVTERSERRASERVPGTFRTVAPREVSAILRVMSPLSKPLVRRLARRAAPPCARRACVA